MKKKLASFVCLVLFSAAAMGTGKKKPEDAGAPVSSTPATAAPIASGPATTGKAGKKPAADAKPDPAADYKGFEDANLDGKKAFGKTVLSRMRRGDTTDANFTGFSCNDKGSGNFAYLTYTDSQRGSIRAMPQLLKDFRDECPRVLFKIKGTAPYSKTFRGEVVEILDITPEEAEAAPAGADYGSLDTVLMDGPAKYKGKVVEFEARRTTTKDKYINVSQCNNTNGYMEVKFKSDQKDAVKRISTDYNHCTTIKVKLGAPKYYGRQYLVGDLVEVK